MANMSDQIAALAVRMASECNQIRFERGPLADLQTTDKTSIVRAINELKARIDNGGGGGGGGAGIDDSITSTTTTWSSTKITAFVNAAIDALPAAATIDDLTTSNASVWSSQKTAQAISAAIAALPPIPSINDGAVSNSGLWSSAFTESKIYSLINNNVAGPSNTWSGSKIQAEIDAAISAGSEIDDNATASDSTWSSSKTSSEIADAVADVSKATIGLGNVDNTSDANKPVSTAQAAADTAILNASMAYTDDKILGLYDDQGNYDASSNTFPTVALGGGAVEKGDIWRISVPGTLGGTAVVAGQYVRALVAVPGQTASNWAIDGSNFAISQTITDGATGTAPSSDAVYDALQLKQDKLSVGTAAQYRRGDGSLADFNASAIGSVLAGLSMASSSNVTAADTILQAVGKLQAQATAGAVATAAISKTSLGLGNVDNTSDANKPVSTAQAAADTATLNAAKAYTDGKPAAATNTDGLPEGVTNKYMTQSGVLGMLLAGLSTASGAVVAATDTIIVSIGKLQKQITDLAASAVTLTGAANLSNKTLTDPLITGYREKITTLTAGTAFSPDPVSGSYIVAPTTGTAVVTMPAVVAGRSWTLEVKYGGIHDLSFAGATINWTKDGAPTPTKLGSRRDLYVFVASGDGLVWLGSDGGRGYF